MRGPSEKHPVVAKVGPFSDPITVKTRYRLGATGEGILLPQEVGRELAFNLGRVNDDQAFAIREGHAVINHEVSRIPCGPGRPSLKTQQQADRRRERPQARSTASAGTT